MISIVSNISKNLFLYIFIVLSLSSVGALRAQDTLRASILAEKSPINIGNQPSPVPKPATTPKTGFLDFWVYKTSLSFCLYNDQPQASTFFIYVGSQDLFKQSSIDMVRSRRGINGLIVSETNNQVAYNGFLVPVRYRQSSQNLQTLSYTIPANQQQNVTLHFYDLPNRKADTHITAFNGTGYMNLLQKQEISKRNSGFISNLYVGALLIMICFFLAIYIQNKLPDFGYYAWYLIGVLLFGVLDVFPLHFNAWYIWEFPERWIYAKEIVAYVYLIGYHLFLMQFLTIKNNKPLLYKILYFINIVCALLWSANMGALLFGFDVQVLFGFIIINSVFFYGLFVFYLFLFWQLWTLRNIPFSKYLFWGSFSFYLGNILGILFGNFSSFSEPFFPNNFMQIGTLIEILFFALALGRKLLLDSEEKNRFQKVIIAQLEEKKTFMASLNLRLEQEVAAKTTEIVAQTYVLQATKEEKTRIQFQQQLQEMQLYALQTRLNPHFLFNCLNTIKSLVLAEKNEQASIYLSKFASLMRTTLENSAHLRVSLQQNIAYLRMYIELERLRFGEDFQFSIDYEGEEAPELLEVPPMLIQPFVENAIIHGLVPIKREKKLLIRFIESEFFLHCEIIDNGNGFQENSNPSAHQSKGMAIIKNYFDLWNSGKTEKASFSVSSNRHTGTSIHIEIPI